MYEDSNCLTPSAQAPIQDKGLALLAQAIEKKECKKVHIYAHALKGSAANVSAYAFIQIAQKMETATRENDMSTMKEDFEDLKVELKKLVTELNTYVQAQFVP